jgi:hypothetical protein
MLKKLRFALTKSSSNSKTGPIPVTVSSRATCPDNCPFKEAGCYADVGFYTRIHWDAVTRGERGKPLAQFLEQIQALPAGQLFRHNVSGDLPHTAGRISRRFMRSMTAAAKGKRGFTYTHHSIGPAYRENAALLRYANRNGFTVNVSTESEKGADYVLEAGLPAVLVVPSTETRTAWRTPAGNAVVICPAQRSDSHTCSDCALCHNRGARVVIAFKAHGMGKTKVEAAIAKAQT